MTEPIVTWEEPKKVTLIHGVAWGGEVVRTDVRGVMAEGAWENTLPVTMEIQRHIGEPADGYRRIETQYMICPSDKSVTGYVIDVMRRKDHPW